MLVPVPGLGTASRNITGRRKGYDIIGDVKSQIDAKTIFRFRDKIKYDDGKLELREIYLIKKT